MSAAATLQLVNQQQQHSSPNDLTLSGNLVRLGRGICNDYVLESLQISRRHAEFVWQAAAGSGAAEGSWFVRDVSTNGLTVNGSRLPKHELIKLAHKDLIQLVPTPGGGLTYRILYGGGAAAAVESGVGVHHVDLDVNGVELIGKRRLGQQQFGPPCCPTIKKSKPDPELVCLSEDDEEEEDELLELEELSPSVIVEEETPNAAQPNPPPPPTSNSNSQLLSEITLLKTRLASALARNAAHQTESKLRIGSLESELGRLKEKEEGQGKRLHKLLDQELACCICSEVFIEATVTTCGHTFCSHCITEWVTKKKQDCPICRMPVNSLSKHVELGCFIDKVHGGLLPSDVQVKRARSLQERRSQVNAATAAAIAASAPPVPVPAARIQPRTRFVDFIAELQHINDMFVGGGAGVSGAAAEQARRSSGRSRGAGGSRAAAGAGPSRSRLEPIVN